MTTGRLAAVVLARDRAAETRRTVDALLAQEPPPDELVLIDNDATPEVRAVLAAAAGGHPSAHVIKTGRNLGCAGGFEHGLRWILERLDVEHVCGFDDDATPLPGCLAALRDAAATLPDVGAVGAVSHAEDGTLAWPMWPEGEREPVFTTAAAQARAGGHAFAVHNLAWHGLLFPAAVLREHGLPWGELFLQWEDVDLGLRLREAGLHSYLVPAAGCRHPAPPPARKVSVLGRTLDITAQSAAKEYLTLRNGLAVHHRHDGLRFWYGTGPLLLIRGFLSALALAVPRRAALRHVFLRGVWDAARGRLGPPPERTAAL